MGLFQQAVMSEKGDYFYHGVIARLFRGNAMGIVRTESKREIPFSFEHVILLGNAKIEDLKEGMAVGYDVSWTSSGLRVSKIKPL
jgi:hypothetical protein